MEKFQTLPTNDMKTVRKIPKKVHLNQFKPQKSTLSDRFRNFNKILNTKNELKILTQNTTIEYNNSIDNSNSNSNCNRFNTLSFEKYDEMIENSLNKYKPIYIKEDKKYEKHYQQKSLENHFNKKSNYKPISNDKISRNNNKLKFLRQNSNPFVSIKINSKNFNYENPDESLKVLNCNNDIYNEINKDSFMRQKILYNNSLIKNYEDFILKYKMPKIKISDKSKINEDVPMVNLIEDQKKEEELLPTIPNTDDLKLFSYFKYPEKNFPESREQFSICIKNKNIILSGGLSTKMKEMNIWSLNIKNIQWSKISILENTDCRFGHTTIYYQQKIYFYGGRIKELNTSILIGLEIFSFTDKKFTSPNILNNPPNRRDHIAIKINNEMLIHGGIDYNNQILNDCYILNLQTLNWYEPIIEKYSNKPKIYGHTCCLVIPTNILTNIDFDIYKYPEEKLKLNPINKIKEKGLYIFGGRNDFGLSNELWILIFGKIPLVWKKIETKGIPPSPRYFHTMDYFEKGNYLIVHGGRNDNISVTSALNDTFVLDLENLEWIFVNLYSNVKNFKVISRYGHKSTIFSNKLIIFGGMNNNNYIGSSLFIVNLDFYYNCDYKNDAERKIHYLKKDNKRKQLKIELGKLKLGVVLPINLPPIK